MKYKEFTRQHLEETKWTYFEHLAHSLIQTTRLLTIAVKSLIHGIFPWLYPYDGPLGIYKIYKEIRQMHHVQKAFKHQNSKN
jgi:hypothetical protein